MHPTAKLPTHISLLRPSTFYTCRRFTTPYPLTPISPVHSDMVPFESIRHEIATNQETHTADIAPAEEESELDSQYEPMEYEPEGGGGKTLEYDVPIQPRKQGIPMTPTSPITNIQSKSNSKVIPFIPLMILHLLNIYIYCFLIIINRNNDEWMILQY